MRNRSAVLGRLPIQPPVAGGEAGDEVPLLFARRTDETHVVLPEARDVVVLLDDRAVPARTLVLVLVPLDVP